MDGGYRTRQKDIILSFIKAGGDRHMTAGEIAAGLSGQVGVTTVYRTLEKLENSGEVRKFIAEEGKSACYQYVPESGQCNMHFHLKCLDCGRLIHLDCEFMNELDEHIRCDHGFTVDSSRTVLYGHCGCREK
jgi:Fur family ferric uptake transcriptional regulator